MKKLSIEEEAKAYREAIERAKNIKTGKCETTFIFTEGLFDYLFPELEECNEEEVREAMIDFFKHEREEGVVVSHYGVNIERMIAWLEKQGQVNETIISQHENKICKENNDSLTSEDERIKKYLLSMFSDPNDSWDGISAREIIAWLEKQNPAVDAKVFIPKFRVGDIVKSKSQPMLSPSKIASIGKDCYYCDDGCIGFAWEDDCEIVEQKPAWSEEDENEVAILEAYIRSGEWSESHIDRALGIVDELVNKVKSLIPQKQWKPSEKQMEALKEACDEHWEPDGLDPLYTLYQELKKLREE